MDPAEYAGQTWNLVSDLASRFRFAVRLSVHLPAEQVAADLKALFLRHGAPLFLKRDNGSNLVNAAVDAVLPGNQLLQVEYTWERRQAVKSWTEQSTLVYTHQR